MRHIETVYALLCGAMLAVSVPTIAYDSKTHQKIGLGAATASSVANQSVLSRFGVSPGRTFPSPSGEVAKTYLPQELIGLGAVAEDLPKFRVVNHFYNAAQSGQGLTLPVLGEVFLPSPDWALEDKGQKFLQAYAYADARNYLYDAVTNLDAAARSVSFGLLFETLGHVIHHLADMAQPQHVRNDPHLDAGTSRFGTKCSFVLPVECAGYLAYLLIRTPSHYEDWTDKAVEKGYLLPQQMQTYAPVYSQSDTTTFNAPRKFWWNDDDVLNSKGLAQFTATNFLSAGTLKFGTPFIDAQNAFDMDILNLCNGAAPACPPGLTGMVRMYPIPVRDRYRPETSGPNPYGVSESLFDQYLNKLPNGQRTFALNRFNFAYQHAYLIPRAIGYSAGLLNYFFRGELEISLPDDGVYGIVDHTIPSGSDPIVGGFATIKVKVRNVTPGLNTAEGRELMAEGTIPTLRAVARFHRNTCYKADLSGEYGSPGVNWQNWNANPMLGCGRNPVEEIVVSEPTPVPKGINNAAQAVTFRFIDQKIPISATDLFLQVIYRGPLGEETDAVVVATKDISEPTYIYHYTRWDQYRYKCPSWPAIDASFCGGNYSFEDWCTPAFPTVDACRETMGLTAKTKFAPDAAPISGYDPNANPQVPPETWADRLYEPFFSPLATLKAPVGTLARVAVLLDTAPANTQLMVFESIDPTHQSELFIWFTDASPSATINQVDPSTNSLVPSVRYLPGRGVFLPEQENFLLNSGEATPIPLLTLTPSRIDPTYLP